MSDSRIENLNTMIMEGIPRGLDLGELPQGYMVVNISLDSTSF